MTIQSPAIQLEWKTKTNNVMNWSVSAAIYQPIRGAFIKHSNITITCSESDWMSCGSIQVRSKLLYPIRAKLL